MTEETALSGDAGGIIGKFFLYDLICTWLIVFLVCYHMQDIEYNTDDWRIKVSFYFGKVMMGLTAFPFLIFQARAPPPSPPSMPHLSLTTEACLSPLISRPSPPPT